MPKKLTLDQVLLKFNTTHNNKYDYSKVDYKNSTTKVKIICKEHGPFHQTPSDHFNSHGCPKCAGCGKYENGKDYFIERASKIHNNKYDYNKVKYINAKTKVKIKCKKHGYFNQNPNNHLHGQGCMKCRNELISSTNKHPKEYVIKNMKITHNNKYEYPDQDFNMSSGKIRIICPIHGEFEQNIINHYYNGNGCEKCGNNRLSKGETNIEHYLKENKVEYIREKTFDKCINPKTNKKLPFDFYLPLYNICIEYDGYQHFNEAPWFKIGKKELIEIKERDNIKNNFCKNNNISLIRISYLEFNNIKNTLWLYGI
jgi:hypothetical protein